MITEITFGELAVNHIVLDPGGDEWIVRETKHGYLGPTIWFYARIERYQQSLWIHGTFSDPIPIVDQTIGNSVETVGQILGGHIVMEPITVGPAKMTAKRIDLLRAKLAGHLKIHHGLGVTGDKTMGTLQELVALHAAQHTPVSVSGIPHVHKELP